MADGSVAVVSSVQGKKACFCPLPEHDDNNPSAFIRFVEERNQHMIFCSACDAIGWSKKNFADKSGPFYFLGKDIIEIGVSESQLYITKTASEAYYIVIGAHSDTDQEMAYRELVEKKRLSTISRVDYVGSPDVDIDGCKVDLASGVITMSVAAIPVTVQDY